MANKRPFGITLLAIFVALAAVVAIIHTLQFLHILPFNLFGEVRFFGFDIWGALLWGMMAAIYLWVFRMLWTLNPQGWLFVVVVSVLNLIVAFMSILGDSTWQSMLPALLINGLVLLYALLPGTKAAFSVPTA